MDPIDVIYFEDDDIESQIMQLGMRKWGINILHVPGMTAHTMQDMADARYQAAHAILFDAVLAGINGLDVAQQLRERGDNRVFFIITAGQNPNSNMLKQLEIGFLQKPVDFAYLAQLIRERVGEKQNPQ